MSDPKRSDLREDMFGNEYIRHEDANGNVTGYSDVREDMFGNEYIRHTDAQGNVTGYGEVREDIFGNQYIHHESVGNSKQDTPVHPETSEASGSGDVFAVIGSILTAIVAVLWKLIKSISFWGIYAAPLLLMFLMTPVKGSGGGSTNSASFNFGFVLIFYVLHTIALIRRRKQTGADRNWPIHTGFLLLIASLPTGTFFLSLICCVILIIIALKQPINRMKRLIFVGVLSAVSLIISGGHLLFAAGLPAVAFHALLIFGKKKATISE